MYPVKESYLLMLKSWEISFFIFTGTPRRAFAPLQLFYVEN